MQYRPRTALSAALLLATGIAQAQDLAILPAPADAWRITVGHWEAQVELAGDGVAAPAPRAEYARNGYAGISTHVATAGATRCCSTGAACGRPRCASRAARRWTCVLTPAARWSST